MSAWLIYFWTRLDSINILFGLSSIVLLLITAIFFLVGKTSDDDSLITMSKRAGITGVVVLVLSVLIPTKKDAAIIYVVPKLTNSKIITEKCPELAKLGIEALKQQLIEFTITENKK